MNFAALFIAGGLALVGAARGEEIESIHFRGTPFTVCTVNVTAQPLRLFWRDEAGVPFKTFDALNASLRQRNLRLTFAMNAGMYHADFSPVGLYVENGRELRTLNLQSGVGNFFLRPNGVFAITAAGACIVESSAARTLPQPVRLATQSGPMLVIDGRIHPAFKPQSDSRLYRNGVGVVTPEKVAFAISEEPVNFHEFAVFFRDRLRCQNALFLDGTISSLYSAKLWRNDRKIDLGPIIGTVEPLP